MVLKAKLRSRAVLFCFVLLKKILTVIGISRNSQKGVEREIMNEKFVQISSECLGVQLEVLNLFSVFYSVIN